MKLKKLRILGFQSFSDTGEIEFSDGINLIVGQNNSGKSAILRALQPNFIEDKHRTPKIWESTRIKTPKIALEIASKGSEVSNYIYRFQYAPFIPLYISDTKDMRKATNEFFSLSTIIFNFERIAGGEFTSAYPSHGLFHYPHEKTLYSVHVSPRNGVLNYQLFNNNSDTLPNLFEIAWRSDMFYFEAERMMIGEAPVGNDLRLTPNANNLPRVLSTLMNERGEQFERIRDHLREIFPTFGNISVRINPQNSQFEIRIWPTKAMERVELSFPLSAGGTGVAQVLALLTAIVTNKNAIILVDEINTFLHPSAVKSLIRIIQTHYSTNQYIITTHSPDVINYSNPSTVVLVKRDGYVSSIFPINLMDIENVKEIVSNLGVTMADVFSSDKIIWVEGRTEELCFPYIYQSAKGPIPRGITITSVLATGDFLTKKRDKAIAFEIYERITSAVSGLTSKVVFSFDSEKLSDDEKKELEERSKNLVSFLPRRHLECYLLCPEAIKAYLFYKDASGDYNVEKIEREIEDLSRSKEYHIPQWNNNINDIEWLKRVDAANILRSLCQNLSDSRVSFCKGVDSLYIMKIIIEISPDSITELTNYVSSLVEKSNHP